MLSKKFKYYSLLISIFFLHLFSVIVCGFNDVAKELAKPKANKYFANLKNVSYGAGFFIWWSAGTSLITFFGVIYRLIKKNNTSYGTQFFDLNVIILNLSSGIIFTAGGILNMITCGKRNLLTNVPKKGLDNLRKIPIGLFGLNAKQGGIIYNLTGHIFAPILVIYFFGKFSATNLLKEKLKATLFASSLNPTVYFLYIFSRPIIDYQNSYRLASKSNSYDYPPDYPFRFLNRLVGKPTGKGDTYKSTGLKQFFGIILVHSISYLAYLLLAYCLIRGKDSKQKSKIINIEI